MSLETDKLYTLPLPTLDETHVPTTTEMLQTGGNKPENLQALKQAAVAYRVLEGTDSQNKLYALILEKSRIYSASADLMVYIAQEQRNVRSIADLTPQQLSEVMLVAHDLQHAYESAPNIQENEVALKFIAINYHAAPITGYIHGQKAYAQSLGPLHLHAAAYTAADMQKLREMPKTKLVTSNAAIGETDIRARDELEDPMMTALEHLMASQSFSQEIIQGCTIINRVDRVHKTRGIVVNDVLHEDVTTPEFATDLILIHKNMQHMFNQIASLFIDTQQQLSENEMPRLYDIKQIRSNIETFFEQQGGSQDIATLAAKRYLLKLAGIIKNIDTTKATERFFLRGFSYTLLITESNEPTERGIAKVSFVPRLMSAGNGVQALGIRPTPVEDPELLAGYLQTRDALNAVVKEHFPQPENEKTPGPSALTETKP